MKQESYSNPLQDLRRVRKHSAATADEVRQFLRELRGKSPKEMLGVVASSSLFRSLTVATIGTAIVIAILTVVPFVWSRMFDKTAAEPAPPPAAVENAAPEPKPQPEPSIDQPRPADTLGIGETKQAPATSNPLENASDDLLRGLE